MENDAGADAYAVVLADLRRQRDEIETAIAAIERLTGVKAGVSAAPTKAPAERTAPAGGSLLGMSIADAARKVLEAKRNKASTAEIVSALEAGGVELTSADKNNTVGSILLRRFYNVGDIVRVNRGVWGLQEWYPGRKFAKGSKVGEVKETAVSKENSDERVEEQEETNFDLRDLGLEPNITDSEDDDIPF
ncbi:hypothetical protein A6F68_01815 [Tsuneonella dongtanensis]|uniref:HTH HARE-type domain-containing protein n=2 Tax=Tsuneonella dongtanensis TaxID=692370 RepID=A0A1B2AE59_9SPHN|nr:hypothetical protein A6F68_01815 [Tsuneonella dongtanensis]